MGTEAKLVLLYGLSFLTRVLWHILQFEPKHNSSEDKTYTEKKYIKMKIREFDDEKSW